MVGLLTSFWLVTAGALAQAAMKVEDLRWNGEAQPLGFIQFEPRLSWVVASDRRGDKQTAYQVLVASSREQLAPGKADLWDSEKVASGASMNVRYAGPTPQARQRAYWTVRVWDAQDRPTPFARPASWEMGLYDEEWEGQWIGGPRGAGGENQAQDTKVAYLRKTFTVTGRIKAARLYASAFGVYSFSLNGKAAHEAVLPPGHTDYEKRVLFQTYDVTSSLRPGKNVLAAVVAGGWCTLEAAGKKGACGADPARIMAQLEITFADGQRQIVNSDQTWKAGGGPIQMAHLHGGERYDARAAMPGWDTPDFRDDSWPPAQAYDTKKERDLVADQGPRTHVSDNLRPTKMRAGADGRYLFDFGDVVSGWIKFANADAGGNEVVVRYSTEEIVENATSEAKVPQDVYVPRAPGRFSWQPRFVLHRFRYVEVKGLSRTPAPGAVTAQVVHSEMPATLTLTSSDPELNELVKRIDWAQRRAFISVPTFRVDREDDVPDLLRGRMLALTGCLNRDVAGLCRKWIDDIRDAQLDDASYAARAPRQGAGVGGPGVGTGGVLVPWAANLCYGDESALHPHLASMGRFLDHVAADNRDFIWSHGHGALPVDPGAATKTDPALLATADFVSAAQALADLAKGGGSNLASYVQRFEHVAKQGRQAFAKRFVMPDGRLSSDTQAAYALALAAGMLDASQAETARPHFIATLERSGHQLTTGLFSTAFVPAALSRIGQDDLAYDVVKKAARSGSPSSPDAVAALLPWIVDAVGGIALDPVAPAGKHVFIRPRPPAGMTWASARFESRHGPISTKWERRGGLFRLRIDVPANTTATVTLPQAGRVRESGRPAEASDGVEVLSSSPTPVLRVASGRYVIEVQP